MPLTDSYLERPRGIAEMWGRYLESGEYSDFLVTCGSRDFHVHRLVICHKSSYFRMLCKDNFKEGITQKLELVDEDPDVFQAVLTFLYTGIYETDKIAGSAELEIPPEGSCGSSVDSENDEENHRKGRPATTEDLVAHIQLYASGDKFDIRDLKDVSSKMFRNQLMRTPVENLDVPQIIQAVYTCTPLNDASLRPVLIDYCVQNLSTLLTQPEMASVLADMGQCAFELLRAYKDEADLRSRKAVEDQRTAVLEIKKAESQQLRESLAKLQKRDTHLMEILASHHNCRNCGKVFGGAPQVYGPMSDRVMLRCKACYTKHS
ncbi:BTB/POZ protein [Talaromyces proteolyticus]|uniref:BTB/POZ protein n=1 Tax=Talaromyces proteolyticus TaxID=1131652 RepID=A0AAD4KWS4_9EURO|nr:BTB/POZ protein [Talaromyces proteolyticus]KAH8698628.1 BTB/POZ protein [Talaromyces proteolyticus]